MTYSARGISEIIIDLHPTIAQVHLEGSPLTPGTVDSPADEAFVERLSLGERTLL